MSDSRTILQSNWRLVQFSHTHILIAALETLNSIKIEVELKTLGILTSDKSHFAREATLQTYDFYQVN